MRTYTLKEKEAQVIAENILAAIGRELLIRKQQAKAKLIKQVTR